MTMCIPGTNDPSTEMADDERVEEVDHVEWLCRKPGALTGRIPGILIGTYPHVQQSSMPTTARIKMRSLESREEDETLRSARGGDGGGRFSMS